MGPEIRNCGLLQPYRVFQKINSSGSKGFEERSAYLYLP